MLDASRPVQTGASSLLSVTNHPGSCGFILALDPTRI
jgi:hypothetical protein